MLGAERVRASPSHDRSTKQKMLPCRFTAGSPRPSAICRAIFRDRGADQDIGLEGVGDSGSALDASSRHSEMASAIAPQLTAMSATLNVGQR